MAIRVHAAQQPLEGVADPRAGAAAAVGSGQAQSDAGVRPNPESGLFPLELLRGHEPLR